MIARVPMTRRERIAATLRDEPTDRPAISLWHHFPEQDRTPDGLAEATIGFQQQYNVDLVKLMPTGMYSVMDYGVDVEVAADTPGGSTRFVGGPVHGPDDWRRLPAVSPTRGTLGDQLQVVRLVRDALGPDTPILQTIFSPLTMAAKLVGSTDVVVRTATEHEPALREALARMADDVVAFGKACLEASVDGFFFATQLAGRTTLPEGLYRRLGAPYDLRILRELRAGAWCTMLHLHGDDPMFELAEEYPVDIVNWHDRDTPPSLAEAMPLTTRALAAGIARGGVIATGRADEAAAEVRDAVRQTNGRRVIVAPGCVIPYWVPADNLRAARHAVEDAKPR